MNPLELDSRQIHEWAKERVAKQGFPLPAKPKGDGEFTFPEDPDSLTNTQLGQLMLRLSAWHSFCLRRLGEVESELLLVEAEHRLKVNVAGLKTREELPGRPAADVVESAVLAQNGDLEPLYRRRLELLTIKSQLDSRAKIYEKSWQALSRFQAMKEMEVRLT